MLTLQLQFVEQGDDDSKLNVQFLLIYRCITNPLFDWLEEEIFPWVRKNNDKETAEEKMKEIEEEMEEIVKNPVTRINEKPYPKEEDKSNEKKLFMRGKEVGLELT